MSEPLEVLAMPRAPSDHPEGSTEWLIANLNSADDIDGMVAERLRDLEARIAALEAALLFYSDPNGDGYEAMVTDYGLSQQLGPIIRDAGERARAALVQP